MEKSTPAKKNETTEIRSNEDERIDDYVIRVFNSPLDLPAQAWDALCHAQDTPTPFMQQAYLAALHASGSATSETGWTPRFVTLWQDQRLVAGCALYLKDHSYGEYVFDWAWARAYQEHGLTYYPKAVSAVPFTPVPGSRLLATDTRARHHLLQAVLRRCQQWQLSSLHLLFLSPADQAACHAHGLLMRQNVQFHWHNHGFPDWDGFLSSLTQDKRKKIKQERRRVADAGVRFNTLVGDEISAKDWDFFYRCYQRTYLEHGNAPYLSPDFFARMARELSQHWVLFVAQRDDRPIACSLIAVQGLGQPDATAYGRYWGALERVDCLHFEACYYQPLQWCIAQSVQRFEGGAQGEHKMARALMPVTTHSAHWLAHPGFADAVDHFLARERDDVGHYLDQLAARSPFKTDAGA